MFIYPWSNLHELNLDWFLQKFKNIFDKWDNVTTSVSTLDSSATPTVKLTETDETVNLDFGLPTGRAGTIEVGTVTTTAAGTSATVTNVGTDTDAILNFGIPRGDTGSRGAKGDTGTAATVTVGTVTTLDPGESATVTNSGTSAAAVLNFGIPKGETGTVENITDSLLSMVYPVGSIYMSVNSTSPASFLGGTWQRIQDRFLLAAGSTYTAGATGGSATHTPSGTVGDTALTEAQLPALTGSFVSALVNGGINAIKSATGVFSLGSRVTVESYNYGTSGTSVEYGVATNFSLGSGESHTHSFAGSAGDTMPPYVAVYMWQRTA